MRKGRNDSHLQIYDRNVDHPLPVELLPLGSLLVLEGNELSLNVSGSDVFREEHQVVSHQTVSDPEDTGKEKEGAT